MYNVFGNDLKLKITLKLEKSQYHSGLDPFLNWTKKHTINMAFVVVVFSFVVYIFLSGVVSLFFGQRPLQELCFAGILFIPKSCKLWSVEDL